MKNVLFVDDEASVLSGLKRMLHSMRSEWSMSFAQGGAEALALMEKCAFDVVVSDMRMPVMDGIQLLTEVQQRMPSAVRMILSGHADRDFTLRSVSLAHRFLTKPCSPEELKGTVRRALALRELLANKNLERVASHLSSLPPLPSLYLEIQRVIADPSKSIEDVGRIVAKDIAMSAKVLQLVNSAFFGVPQNLDNAVDAAVYLGLDTITSLVLTSGVFAHAAGFRPETLQRIWIHSLRTGAFARAILRLEKCDARSVDQAFLAGMLHEIGLLLLATELRDELAQAWKHARRFNIPLPEAERRVIGASHATVGAYLMGIWGLSDPVVEAIAFHHSPAALAHDKISPTTAVHVATALDAENDGGTFGESALELDLAHIEKLGLSARLPVWREACRALVGEEEAA